MLLKLFHRIQNNAAHICTERTGKSDIRCGNASDKERLLTAFERTLVLMHLPIRDTFGAELFMTRADALYRLECNRVTDLALVLFPF